MAQIVAFDYGLKRVGVATSDDDQIIASPLKTVNSKEIFEFISRYLEKNKVEAFVVGLPLNTSGEDTHGTQPAKKFAKDLEKKYPDYPIHFVDERFTSKMAFQSMIDGGLSKKKRRDKSIVDKIAASHILQSFMDERSFNS